MGEREPAPTEVFEQVGNDTRMDVLRALASAHADAPTDPWVEYTDLRDAVGLRDNGNFNYHLDRLGDLVVKGPAGYRISRTGMEVVSAVASGTFDADRTWGPVDAPGDCFACGDPVSLRYEDGGLRLTCGTDDHALALSVPPSLLEAYAGADLIERIAFLENRWGGLTRRGICSECRGRVEGRIEAVEGDSDRYHYRGRCRRCGFQHGIPVGMSLLDHPAVTAFYHDHGVDVRSTPFWTLQFCAPGAETVVSTDPLRLRVDVSHGGERLSLALERDGTVVSTDRSPSPTGADGDGDGPATR